MKTLFIILFTISCYGQDDELIFSDQVLYEPLLTISSTVYQFKSADSLIIIVNKDTVYGKRKLNLTLQHLVDYAKECYADTTWIIKKQYQQMPVLFHNYEIYYDDGYIYYLQTKPTFKGFIEYLTKLNK